MSEFAIAVALGVLAVLTGGGVVALIGAVWLWRRFISRL